MPRISDVDFPGEDAERVDFAGSLLFAILIDSSSQFSFHESTEVKRDRESSQTSLVCNKKHRNGINQGHVRSRGCEISLVAARLDHREAR